MAKKPAKMDKKIFQFVKDHVETKLLRAGFTPEKARDMASEITEADVAEQLGDEKIGALGDGSFLKWLSEHQGDILNAVNVLFKLLALFGEKSGEEANEE